MSDEKLRQELRIRWDSLAELARKLHGRIASDNPDAGSVDFKYQTFSFPEYHSPEGKGENEKEESVVKLLLENLAASRPENAVHEDVEGNKPLDEESIVELVSQYDKEGRTMFISTQSSNFDDYKGINDAPHIEHSDLDIIPDKSPREARYRIRGGKKEGKGATYVRLQLKMIYMTIEEKLIETKQRLMEGSSGKVIRRFSKPEQREKVKQSLREVRSKLKTLAEYTKLCAKPMYMDVEAVYARGDDALPKENREGTLTIGKLFPKQVL
tara:strand:- start:2743 stop:3549 length:807 start_codon:yes stop_codon:yes gene_type:complete